MTRKRYLKFGFWTAAVGIALLLGLRGGTNGTDPPITRITTIHNWRLDVFQSEPYLWLNDHEIFHFTGDTVHGHSSVSLNTSDQATRPEPLLMQTQTGHIISTSPDGQWVLWTAPQCDYDIPQIAATRRSDGKTVRWRFLDLDGGSGFWMPDSHRWIAIAKFPNGKMIKGRKLTERRFVLSDLNQPSRKTFPIPADTGDGRIVGVTAEGKVIVSKIFGENGERVQKGQPLLPLTVITLTGSQAAAQEVLVPLPVTPPTANSTFILSPQGDRMLWVGLSFGAPLPLSRLRNWVSHTYGGETDSKDIWVCHLDGTVPVHVGTWHSSDFGGIYWNPDGKHISLTMANGLYSIPVP